MSNAGRPKIEIDWREFEKLCALQCTQEEIAGWFDCSVDTIDRRVKEVHGVNFAEYFAKKRGKGKISLRRWQMQCAEKGNAAMLIFLGKNYLGQKDSHEVNNIAPIVLKYSLDDGPDDADSPTEET